MYISYKIFYSLQITRCVSDVNLSHVDIFYGYVPAVKEPTQYQNTGTYSGHTNAFNGNRVGNRFPDVSSAEFVFCEHAPDKRAVQEESPKEVEVTWLV